MNRADFKMNQREYQQIESLLRMKQLITVSSLMRLPQDNYEIKKLSYLLQIFQIFERTENLDIICQSLDLKTLQEGQRLYENDKKYLYIVLTGQMNVFNENHLGEVREKIYTQGSFFWYNQFSDVNLIVCAHQETDLVYLSKSLYDFLLKANQDLSTKFILKFLGGVSIFETILSEDLLELSQNSTIIKSEVNSQIIRQGEHPSYCYILLSGTLKVVRQMQIDSIVAYDSKLDVAKQYEVANLQQGDCFCLNSILTDKPVQYSVISSIACQLLKIDRQSILRIEDKLRPQQQEENYIQDELFRNKLQENHQWQKFKQVQFEQLRNEKLYRINNFAGVLRTDYKLNYKRHNDFVKDEQIQRRSFANKSLPPIDKYLTARYK